MTTTVNSAADTGLPGETPPFEAAPIADEFDAEWQRRFLVGTRLGAVTVSKTAAELRAAIDESDAIEAWVELVDHLEWLAKNATAISEMAVAARARIVLIACEGEEA